MPDRIKRLQVDARGYPVPWFVHAVNGVPDHRIVDTARFAPAIREKRCWICGDVLGRYLTFALGPMCCVTRSVSEPASHKACVMYAMQACPFLSRPTMIRRESGLPEGVSEAAGIMEKRNPGAMCLWTTRTSTLFHDGNGGVLFRVGEPTETRWYTEGRPATRPEVLDSLETGLVRLRELAELDGKFALLELEQRVKTCMQYLPGASVLVT